jgi:tetratricopeptide (TPR) repeat protein
MLACEKFLRLDPKNKAVNVALGDAAAAGGHVESAIFAYETAVEHHPNDASVLKKLGSLLWRAGRIQQAHEIYDKAVQIDPRDQEALKARKNLAAEASLKETGFETAGSSRDLVRDKDAAGKLAQSERLYRTDDDLTSQEAELEQKLAEDKDNVELWQDLAEIRKKRRDWAGAKEAMASALKINPDDVNLQFAADDLDIEELEAGELEAVKANNTAEVESIRKRLLDVKTVAFRKRIKAYPTDLNLRFKLGDLLLQKHEMDEAISQFQQTVKDPKFRSESQLRLGQAFASKHQYDLAIRQLENALEGHAGMNERVKEIRYNLGDVLERKGETDKAKEQFGMIYESDIGYRDVSDRLANLESGADAGKLSLDD